MTDARRLVEEMASIHPESALIPTMEADIATLAGDPALARRKHELACW